MKLLLNMGQILKQLLGWLLILLFYSFGNTIGVPNIRSNLLKIFILNKRLFGDIAPPAIFFSHYTSNFLSLFNLGLYPYLNASFFVNMLTLLLQKIKPIGYGEANNNDYIKLIKYFNIFFYILSSLVITDNLSYYINAPKNFIFNNKIPIYLYFLVTLTLLSGSSILLWLSKKIKLYRLGNGIATILFINLLYKFPYKLKEFISPMHKNINYFILPINIILWLGIFFFILFVENISPQININYVQHQYQNDLNLHTYLPLKLNNAGALSIIFSRNAYIILNTLLGLNFMNNGIINMSIQTLSIIFFYIYYNRFTFNPIEIADNFKKSGAIIEGFRPGKDTVKYLTKVIYNINILSSYYIIIICVLSDTLHKLFCIKSPLDGSYLLTLIDTAREIFNQIKELLQPANNIN